jgi:hypothetical protein
VQFILFSSMVFQKMDCVTCPLLSGEGSNAYKEQEQIKIIFTFLWAEQVPSKKFYPRAWLQSRALRSLSWSTWLVRFLSHTNPTSWILHHLASCVVWGLECLSRVMLGPCPDEVGPGPLLFPSWGNENLLQGNVVWHFKIQWCLPRINVACSMFAFESHLNISVGEDWKRGRWLAYRLLPRQNTV